MKYDKDTRPMDIKECDCRKCQYKTDCPHNGAFRRLPKEIGGLGLCKNLK